MVDRHSQRGLWRPPAPTPPFAHGEAETWKREVAGQGHRAQVGPAGPRTPVFRPSAPCMVLGSHQPPLRPLDK